MRSIPRCRMLALLAAVAFCLAASRGAAQEEAGSRRAAAVQDTLDRLAGWVKRRGGVVGASVIDVGSGVVVASVGSKQPLNPASNAKLLTAAAALDRLGPDYTYTTGIYGRLRDGVVRGLVLRGHGDPSLRVADLFRLARALVQRGVRRVEGGILVDNSRFDGTFVPPAFDQQPDEWSSFRAPVSAVAVERNAVTMNVVPARAGEPARVWFDPPGVVSVEGTVRTTAAGTGQGVRLTLRPSGPRLRASVGGHVAEGLPRLRFARRVDDPTLLAGFVLDALLKSMGVQVEGRVAAGGAGEKRRISYVVSAPLSTLLYQLGKNSDNYYAESILKTLGGEKGGRPASFEAGAREIVAWMKKIGAYHDGFVVRNGSGLFDANRVSARALARALRAAYLDPGISTEFVAQLSIGGVDGTLRSRFRKHRRTRAIRAKTGTLARAIALSGYVMSGTGGSPLAFSVLENGIAGKNAEIRRRIDRAVAAMVAYRR